MYLSGTVFDLQMTCGPDASTVVKFVETGIQAYTRYEECRGPFAIPRVVPTCSAQSTDDDQLEIPDPQREPSVH